MIRTGGIITAGLMAAALALAGGVANAKDKVKVGFIGPLTVLLAALVIARARRHANANAEQI